MKKLFILFILAASAPLLQADTLACGGGNFAGPQQYGYDQGAAPMYGQPQQGYSAQPYPYQGYQGGYSNGSSGYNNLPQMPVDGSQGRPYNGSNYNGPNQPNQYSGSNQYGGSNQPNQGGSSFFGGSNQSNQGSKSGSFFNSSSDQKAPASNSGNSAPNSQPAN